MKNVQIVLPPALVSITAGLGVAATTGAGVGATVDDDVAAGAGAANIKNETVSAIIKNSGDNKGDSNKKRMRKALNPNNSDDSDSESEDEDEDEDEDDQNDNAKKAKK